MAKFKIFRRGGSAMSGILNVLGMAVAFAAFYIILVQVNYDLNFNKDIKDSEKIFVMSSGSLDGGDKRQIHFCRPLAEVILQSSPNIECGGVLNFVGAGSISLWKDDGGSRQDFNLNLTSVSGTALKAAGFEAVAGSLDEVTLRNTFAVSETVAEKFGLEVGMQVFSDGDYPCSIVAIYKDMPDNSHFKYVEAVHNIMDSGIDNYSEWSYQYLVKVYDPSQVDQMEKSFEGKVRDYYKERYFGQMPSAEEMGMTQEDMDSAVEKMLGMARCELIPIENLFYNTDIVNQIEKGNKTTTIILLIVALLIVGIAFINYINFFFAQIPERIRAVNTKKVLGGTRLELITATVAESIATITLALVLAAALIMLFNMSHLSHLITADSAFPANVGVAAGTVAIAIAIAVISSLYPAFYITSFEPAMVLKGSFGATKAGRKLRYTLIGLQFMISIVLIICSMFINLQRRYMVNFDMGFDGEQLLYVHTYDTIAADAEAVEERLKSDPQIADVTWASGNLLASERMGWGRDWNGQVVSFQCYPVAYDFPEFMGIEISEGRTFMKEDENSDNGVFIFNDAAKRKYGFTLDSRVSGHKEETEIAGFCKDFSFMTLKEEVKPFALYVYGNDPWYIPATAFIRVAEGADYQKVMKHISSVLSEWEPSVSPDRWDIHFFDENINGQYKKEQALSQLISLFTLVAIIISLMGVFGLVMFETQYRRREIALRRVNGATVRDILEMFSTRFVMIVLVCFAVAAPVSWIIVNRYLATFAHHCPMYWWVFVLALTAVMAVTVGVVVLRSWNAATADPAEALKTE